MSEVPTESRQYGDMLQEVELIAREIDEESMDLDGLVIKVERGYDLIKQMRARLSTTKEKIEKLRHDFEENS